MTLTPRPTLALLLLVLACGPTSSASDTADEGADDSADASADDGTPTTGEPATLAEACGELFDRRREFDARCTGAALDAALRPEHVEACLTIAGSPGSTLTPADISACADQLAGPRCVAFDTYPGCLGYAADLLYPDHDHPGTLEPGAACMAQIQCASGYCSGLGRDCGECQRPRQRGDSCDGPYDLCLASDCIAGICDLHGAKPGEPCIDYGDSECQPDLYCAPNLPGELDGLCTPRGHAGDPCSDWRQCAVGHECQAGFCAPHLAEGSPCTDTDVCEASVCVAGVCGQPRPAPGPGETCPDGLCQASGCEDGVCVDLTVPLGGACREGHGNCGSGLYCAPDCPLGQECAPGTCAELPGPGQPCVFYGLCAPGATCVGFGSDGGGQPAGVCTANGAAGDPCPCNDLLACIAGECVPFDSSVCG